MVPWNAEEVKQLEKAETTLTLEKNGLTQLPESLVVMQWMPCGGNYMKLYIRDNYLINLSAAIGIFLNLKSCTMKTTSFRERRHFYNYLDCRATDRTLHRNFERPHIDVNALEPLSEDFGLLQSQESSAFWAHNLTLLSDFFKNLYKLEDLYAERNQLVKTWDKSSPCRRHVLTQQLPD
ncbi:hypothetical protein DD238_001090 [Peronospora effusa]|uniref:Uncharacterized protein n=1 Tax=Peronospora effusa TaxID=542832 RepID=A0A3M6VJH6_9STRA|nr:hypothetical protein DD238_001090 [Peronospora effusa]RQM18401.1 hypothetical protein DD237_000853 [Peronospora effusa]